MVSLSEAVLVSMSRDGRLSDRDLAERTSLIESVSASLSMWLGGLGAELASSLTAAAEGQLWTVDYITCHGRKKLPSDP